MLNGRRYAGKNFISSIAKNLEEYEELHIVCPEREAHKELANILGDILYRNRKVHIHTGTDHSALRETGAIHLMDCQLDQFANNYRMPLRETDFSISGVIHSLSSKAAIHAIAACVGSDLYPWDAVVCTSKAGHDVVHKIWEERLAYLEVRMGQTDLSDEYLPETPIVGLPGPGYQPYYPELNRRERRAIARQEIGIGRDDFCVCTLGRLSFHSKASPVALYRALNRLGSDRQKVVLLECGQYPNEGTASAYQQLKSGFPNFDRYIYGGGRIATELEKWRTLAAADVYIALSDNLQETFGLSLQEAMLAELPLIVSDWNGYRDSIEDGKTGFLIPTKDVLQELVQDPLESSFYAGHIDYDSWIGIASMGVYIEHELIANSLNKLMNNQDLAAKMGHASLQFYKSKHIPEVISQEYRRLWARLAEKRNEAKLHKRFASGRAPCMRRLFQSYSSSPLKASSIRITDRAAVVSLLKAKMTSELMHLITGSKTPEAIDIFQDNEIISIEDLCGRGFDDHQSRRLIALLLKYGLASIVTH